MRVVHDTTQSRETVLGFSDKEIQIIERALRYDTNTEGCDYSFWDAVDDVRIGLQLDSLPTLKRDTPEF